MSPLHSAMAFGSICQNSPLRGFGKIIDAYKAESDKRSIDIKPFFRSSATAFFVILPNLNYSLKAAAATTDTITDTITVQGLANSRTIPEIIGKDTAKVYRLISLDSNITAERIAARLRLSVAGVRYHLSKMKSANLVRYVGNPKKGGHWEVVK